MGSSKTVNLEHVLTEEDFHQSIALALDFPEYYGRNLDALWDCLGDYRPEFLVLLEWAKFELAMPDFAARIQALLDELVEETRQAPMPFVYCVA